MCCMRVRASLAAVGALLSDVELDTETGAEGQERSTLRSTTAKKSTRPLWRVSGRGKAYACGGEDEAKAEAKTSAFAGGREPSTFSSAKSCCKEEGAGASESRWRGGGGIECGGGGGE